jgi:hypothetical protein
VGGVLSQAEGFRTVGELVPGLIFHALTTGGGLALLGRASARKRATTAVA